MLMGEILLYQGLSIFFCGTTCGRSKLTVKNVKLDYRFGIFNEGGHLGIPSYSLHKTYFQI